MAEPVVIIILPVVQVGIERTLPPGVDLAEQRLRPSSDRRNVVVLERERRKREIEALLRPGRHDHHRKGDPP